MDFRQRRPSAEAFAWVERQLGRGSRVLAWRRMTGGLTSAVHRLTVQRGSGRLAVVLRQYERSAVYDMAKIIEREGSILSGLHASGLHASGLHASGLHASGLHASGLHASGLAASGLAASGLAAPELLAACPAGEETGGNPAILMTRLPGHLDLSPADPGHWLRQMAAAAAAIHDATVSAPAFESWFDTAQLAVPVTATRPALWRAAIGVLQQGPGPAGTRFIHHDFQPFNFLWARGRLTGVVDWTWASAGSPAIDAGHCRLYLAVLSGAGLAEQFRLAYEAEAGRRIDPWWDLHSLAGYNDSWPQFIPLQARGQVRVDVAGMTSRVEDVLAAALRRL